MFFQWFDVRFLKLFQVFVGDYTALQKDARVEIPALVGGVIDVLGVVDLVGGIV